MFIHRSILVAASGAAVAVAQTFNDCDPTNKDCPANPAFGNTVECDFTKGECSAFKALEGTKVNYADRDGAEFVTNKELDAPTLSTSKFLFFGRVEIEVRAAKGAGIATSFVLQSSVLDEIDWEWVGADDAQVQTNYFSRGDTTTFDRGAYHNMSDPLDEFHTYALEWTADAIVWFVDGVGVRTLKAEAADNGAKFPQTPMQIKVGTWVAGRKDAPEGTIEWAGGLTDFSKGPFEAYLRTVKVEDYAGGDKPAEGGIKEYKYTDRSGTVDSIEVVKGQSDDDDEGRSSSADQEETNTPSTSSSESGTTTAPAAVSTTSGSDPETTNGANNVEDSKNDGLSPGAAAGIAVGAVLVLVIIVVVGFLFWRRKRKATKQAAMTEVGHDQSSTPGVSELSSKSPVAFRGELENSQVAAELDGRTWHADGVGGGGGGVDGHGPAELDAHPGR